MPFISEENLNTLKEKAGRECRHKTCKECGHMFEESTGKMVVDIFNYLRATRNEVFYCKEHAPNYDRKKHDWLHTKYFRDKVEVDEKGTPIGFVPEKKK